MIEVIQFRGFAPGPRLLVTAAVHGNEVCGIEAVRRVAAQFSSGARTLARGVLSFVPVANPVAHRAGRREGERNLNRDFRHYPSPSTAEDHIANALAPVLDAHDALVDLHSFAAPGKPFVFLGPLDNRDALEPFAHERDETRLALATGLDRLVYGWLPAYAGGAVRRQGGSVAYGIGTTEYMRSRGGYAITVECGQHSDPEAPARAERAIEGALALLQLEAGRTHQPPPSPDHREWIQLMTVHDRIDAADHFPKRWHSFDALEPGQLIATRANGEQILAPETGYVVFPNPDAPVGREWFYFARRSDRGGRIAAV